MKVLVTGACGFIGSHLYNRLLKDGHEVVGLDDLSNGKSSNISGGKLILGNICNPQVLPYGDKFDWIFHLAAKADIVPSIEMPERYHDTNVNGTLQVLEFAKKTGCKKLVYAASSSCYGIPNVFPTSESAEIRPMYPYALTKWIGEQYVLHWSKVYKIPALSLRLFNVYGPRSRTSGAYGAVFGVFLSQIMNGKPLTVVGDGRQTRDFTYVDDVVEAFIKAAQSSASGIPINIGTGQSQSVNYLTSLLEYSKIDHIPDRPGEPRMTLAENGLAQILLGWTPKTSFEDGVKVMKNHMRDYADAPLWTKESIGEATKSWFEAMS